MRGTRERLIGTVALLVASLSSVAIASAQSIDELRSIYVRMNNDIVTVDAVGPDVRVRAIRIAYVNEYCPGLVVSAIERTIPHTTVQAVAGVHICSITDERARRAVAAAPSRYSGIDFIGSLDVVEADCGTGRREFVHQQPPIVDDKKLRRSAPDVWALWDLGDRLRSLAAGRQLPAGYYDPFDFAAPTSAAGRAPESLGTTLLPELVSGRFQDAFGGERCWNDDNKETPCTPNYWAWRLRKYQGPPLQRGLLPVELVERESLALIAAVVPEYPAIALSARVQGDVRLRLSADPTTGSVTAVEPLDKWPLSSILVPPAVAAARKWQFEPASTPRQPVDVTLRFALRCPVE
jgi:hypothetical protein